MLGLVFGVLGHSTIAQAAWTYGAASELTTSTTTYTSCSIGTTGASGQSLSASGATMRVYGQCSYPPSVDGRSALGRWLAAGITTADVEHIRFVHGTSAGSGTIRLQAGSPGAGAAIVAGSGIVLSELTSAACGSTPLCATFSFKVTGDGSTASNWLSTDSMYMQWHSATGASSICGTFCFTTVGSLPAYKPVGFSQPSFGLPQPSPQYWNTPYTAPGAFCGAGGIPAAVTGSTPIPHAVTPFDPAYNATVRGGSFVKVVYGAPIADGQVWAKFADQTTWAKLGWNSTLSRQEINLARTTGFPDTTARAIEFRCEVPHAPGTYLYSRFVQNMADPTGGNWQVFMSTEAVERPCGTLTIGTDLPRTGYIPIPTDEVFTITSVTDHAAGVMRITWSWQAWGSTWPTEAWSTGVAKTFTIAGETDEVGDRYYERLSIMCRDQFGTMTIRGGLATNELDPLSTNLFPHSVDLAACFDDMGGMELDSPSTWVKGAGQMLSCLLRGLFIPSEMDMDALRRRLTGATGDWSAPITALVSGVTQLTGVDGDCSYSATLPINGGLSMSFDSCSGPVATGRNLVYTASSVSIALYGLMWLRAKSVAVLSMNSAAALRSEAIRLDGDNRRHSE